MHLVRFLVAGIDNGDEMWLMESVTKEVRDVSTTPGRQPPARAICTLETARDFTAEQSSDGGSDRHGGLDGDGIAGREGPRQKGQECGGTTAELARDTWGVDVDGDSKDALPRGGGADSVLRAGAIPVRPDRDGLDAGLHDDPGFRAASGRRAIPHPNEMGLLGGFVRSIAAAAKKAGRGFQDFLGKVHGKCRAAKEKVRKYRLFAKSKTKGAKDRMVAQMTSIVEDINRNLGKALAVAAEQGRKLRGHAVVAQRKLLELHETMAKLVPQIRHWLRTGFVASGKVINLHIPQLYSIVRGKVGKAVEFGLSWGITRMGGGFVLATMAATKADLTDASYAVRAVEDLAGLFGKPPRAYAYDRGGYSTENVQRLRKLGVRDVGLAPRGRTSWEVEGKVKDKLIRERTMVEGSIGTIKCPKYGFNRPAARSTAMMGVCGQRAVLGLNLTKLLRGVAQKKGVALAV